MSNTNDRNNNDQPKPVVSARIKKLATAALLAGGLLTGSAAQASVPGSVTYRAAAVRDELAKRLSQAPATNDQTAVQEKLPYSPVQLAQWLNWGNWGNWNNWNNWRKWSNWGDFSNF
jgi:hypothetical protein